MHRPMRRSPARVVVPLGVGLLLACSTPRPLPLPAHEAWTRALAAHEAGDLPGAARHWREALAALGDTDDFALERGRLLTGLSNAVADPEESLAALREALPLLERAGAPPEELAVAAMGIGARLRQTQRCAEAKSLLESTIAGEIAAGRAFDSGLLLNLANVHVDCGDLARARRLYNDAIVEGGDKWRTSALRGLATIDLLEGDLASADSRSADALVRREQAHGGTSPALVVVLDLRSCILRLAGRDAEGEEAALRAESIRLADPDWNHPGNHLGGLRLAERCR